MTAHLLWSSLVPQLWLNSATLMDAMLIVSSPSCGQWLEMSPPPLIQLSTSSPVNCTPRQQH